MSICSGIRDYMTQRVENLVFSCKDTCSLYIPFPDPVHAMGCLNSTLNMSLIPEKIVKAWFALISLKLLYSIVLRRRILYGISIINIVLNCIWACFKRLFLWLRQGYDPNHFIKTNNIIAGKIVGEDWDRLLEPLHNLYTSIMDTVTRIWGLYYLTQWTRLLPSHFLMSQ